MRSLDIVFMGTPDFAVPSLRKLADSGHRVQLVVTAPDKRRGRRQQATPTPVKAEALEHNILVLETDDMQDAGMHQQLEQIKPDLIVVVAFKLLPESVLAVPKTGSINLHASLLPKYRGAAPIHHAIINGESETGCTVFFLDKHMDTGNIIDWCKTQIGIEETTGEVYERLRFLGADLMVESVEAIAGDNVQLTAQDESKACPAPKLFKEDARIDFNLPMEQVHNLVRGLSPFPGAWTEFEGQHVNIYRSRLVPEKQLEPGVIASEDDKMFAGCGTGAIEIAEIQLEGRRKLSGGEFLRGFHHLPEAFDR